jgi:hypothetical protein
MLFGGLALLVTAGFSAGGRNGDDPLNWPVDRWVAWRDAEIGRILSPDLQFKEEKLLSRQDVIDRSVEPYLVIEHCLRADPKFFADSKPIGQEMSHFAAFVRAQHWMAQTNGGAFTNDLGYEITDAQYWSYAKRSVQFPPLLSSQEFLRDLSRPATYKAAVDLIEAANSTLPDDRKWVVLPFLSQFIKSADRSTYGRLLVFVPNEPVTDGVVDRWIQFAIAVPEGNAAPDIQSVSMVAISRASADSGVSKSYLMDFLRISDSASNSIKIVPTPLFRNNPSNNCYDCHKAAVIPIRPECEYSFDDLGNLVPKMSGVGEIPEMLNHRISGYGPIDLGVQDAGAYGPSLGPAADRSDDSIRKASGMDLTAESAAHVRAAMRCASCHDSFAKLNYPLALRTSRDVKGFKSNRGLGQSFVEKGWMPPGNTLTDQERRVLWLALTKEYYDPAQKSGIFIDWLRGQTR